jgi:hypothetical protein
VQVVHAEQFAEILRRERFLQHLEVVEVALQERVKSDGFLTELDAEVSLVDA